MSRAYKCKNKNCGKWLPHDYGWDLCKDCYTLSKEGRLVRTRFGWQEVLHGQSTKSDKIYEKRNFILTPNEQRYYWEIKKALPAGFMLHPQVALSSVIHRTDDPDFIGELNRVPDFVVTDEYFRPFFAIEVNDRTHSSSVRKQRDKKVLGICGEANLPVEIFYTRSDSLEFDTINFEYRVKSALQKVSNNEYTPFIFKVVDSPANTPIPSSETPSIISQGSATSVPPECSWGLMLFYTVFFGWLGLHRFYAEKMISGVIYLMTLGLFGVGWVIDIFAVLTTLFRDKHRRRIKI